MAGGAVRRLPVLRPLCLALKALLADQKLADASQGGLGEGQGGPWVGCWGPGGRACRRLRPAAQRPHLPPALPSLPPSLHRSNWALCSMALALLLEQRKAACL